MAEVESIVHEGWAELVLNRPEVRNAINGPFGVALATELKALGGNEAVKVILLRGADGAFCSGLDLKAFNADPAPEWLAVVSSTLSISQRSPSAASAASHARAMRSLTCRWARWLERPTPRARRGEPGSASSSEASPDAAGSTRSSISPAPAGT